MKLDLEKRTASSSRSVYLSDTAFGHLTELADIYGQPVSRILEAAILAFGPGLILQAKDEMNPGDLT